MPLLGELWGDVRLPGDDLRHGSFAPHSEKLFTSGRRRGTLKVSCCLSLRSDERILWLRMHLVRNHIIEALLDTCCWLSSDWVYRYSVSAVACYSLRRQVAGHVSWGKVWHFSAQSRLTSMVGRRKRDVRLIRFLVTVSFDSIGGWSCFLLNVHRLANLSLVLGSSVVLTAS